MIGTIYLIISKKSKKYYIGSTIQTLKQRKQNHLKQLKNETHSNTHLKNVYNKYNDLEFICIAKIEVKNNKDLQNNYEQLFLDKIFNQQTGKKVLKEFMNIANTAGGGNLGEEVNKKISENRKGKKCGKEHQFFEKELSEKHKNNISKSKLKSFKSKNGIKIRKKISNGLKKYNKSENSKEHKIKIGKRISEFNKNRTDEKHHYFNKKRSLKTKNKISKTKETYLSNNDLKNLLNDRINNKLSKKELQRKYKIGQKRLNIILEKNNCFLDNRNFKGK